jgi:hypothetical protein
MRARGTHMALAAVVATLAAAGCGGGSDPPSKAEFIKKGNAICRKGNHDINAAVEKTFSGDERPSTAKIKAFGERTAIPRVQREIDQLRRLGTPSKDQEEVEAFLGEAQSALDKVKADPALFATQEQHDPFAEANRLAKSYGLKVCGEGA